MFDRKGENVQLMKYYQEFGCTRDQCNSKLEKMIGLEITQRICDLNNKEFIKVKYLLVLCFSDLLFREHMFRYRIIRPKNNKYVKHNTMRF